MVELIIAEQRNYSSWSLRAWLVLRWGGIDFAERIVSLAQPGYGAEGVAEVAALSPNGLVPAVRIGGVVIWDSLAIAEWAADQSLSLWPGEPLERAAARALAAEMHAGFVPLRRDLPMNILRRCKAPAVAPDTRRSIARIDRIWSAAHGEFLFQHRSIADAFFLPVATRLRSYGIALTPPAQRYADTLLADPAFREWEAACVGNSWDHHGLSVIDGIYPETEECQ